jgi:DNA-binding CsgD family transcriptional regulator
MSATPAACATSSGPTTDLTEKQQRILRYLREEAGTKTYFKSRLIADELGLSAKEVGANMSPLLDGEFDVEIEKWGYSSGTTWKVTA